VKESHSFHEQRAFGRSQLIDCFLTPRGLGRIAFPPGPYGDEYLPSNPHSKVFLMGFRHVVSAVPLFFPPEGRRRMFSGQKLAGRAACGAHPHRVAGGDILLGALGWVNP